MPTTTPPATTAPPATTTAPAINAAALYASNCVSCHGANRQGVTSGTPPTVVGPAIPSTSAGITSRTEAQLATFLTTHKAVVLTAAQFTALAAYLKNP